MNNAIFKTEALMKPKQFWPIKAIKQVKKRWQLYVMITPVVLYFIIFDYWPMYGIQLAFKNFVAVKGIMGSPWVGLRHFSRFFNSYHFWNLIKNTVGVSLYSLIVGFPIPIILALMMNEVRNKHFKKTVQTITYAPHFLSTVVLVSMIIAFLSPSSGILNHIIKFFGGKPISFMTEPSWFKTIYVFSGVWQGAGWGSIIYMAALAGVDIQMYEAAIVDGASKWQRMVHITIPSILPTATIMLILNAGKIMSVGFEKVFLMQNGLNLQSSDVISTYVYRVGLLGAEYSFSTAVGLFNSIINFLLLILVNSFAKRFSESTLW